MTPDRRWLCFMFSTVVGFGWSGCAGSAETALHKDAQKTGGTSAPPASPAPEGRYQLVVVPGYSGNPFLIDTSTGCVWHFAQNDKTKRVTFIETDVENLHWGWGSGAQQILAAQIDTLSAPEAEKKVLRQNLQKTECGQFNVTLSAEHARKSEQPSESKPASPEK